MNKETDVFNSLLKRSFYEYIPVRCSHCGFDYTHQFETHVFERPEDAKHGNHVTVNNNDVKIDRDISKNPSGRRHGVSILLSCEGCDGITRLDIIQHKGNTLIEVHKT